MQCIVFIRGAQLGGKGPSVFSVHAGDGMGWDGMGRDGNKGERLCISFLAVYRARQTGGWLVPLRPKRPSLFLGPVMDLRPVGTRIPDRKHAVIGAVCYAQPPGTTATELRAWLRCLYPHHVAGRQQRLVFVRHHLQAANGRHAGGKEVCSRGLLGSLVTVRVAGIVNNRGFVRDCAWGRFDCLPEGSHKCILCCPGSRT